ncbi:hypothetical protein D3C85_1218060 [compost metagenome]
MIAPQDCVEKTAAVSDPEAFKLFPKKVPSVTNHAPQIKNSRNIIRDNLMRIVVFIKCGWFFGYLVFRSNYLQPVVVSMVFHSLMEMLRYHTLLP